MLALFAATTVGCGRPATKAECEEILERVAKLELEKTAGVPAEDVDRHVAETKEAMQERIMKLCVGKRITDSALRCVERATTAKEIVEECFD